MKKDYTMLDEHTVWDWNWKNTLWLIPGAPLVLLAVAGYCLWAGAVMLIMAIFGVREAEE